MGEWLQDTVDAANFMADKMEQARAAPRLVAQEMHAYALGLADETAHVLNTVRQKGMETRSASGAQPPRTAAPPPCNTGGKVPNVTKSTRVPKGPK